MRRIRVENTYQRFHHKHAEIANRRNHMKTSLKDITNHMIAFFIHVLKDRMKMDGDRDEHFR